MNPAYPFDIYPFKELMLFSFLAAMTRLHENAQTEAKSTPNNPSAPVETKLKNSDQRNLTKPQKGSTVKLLKTGLPQDVVVFMSLPPQIREQLLRYGARWTQALFEPKP